MARPVQARFTDLPLRILSAVVLGAIVFGAIWLGGLPAALLAAAAAGILGWEVLGMVAPARRAETGLVALVVATAALGPLLVLYLPWAKYITLAAPLWLVFLNPPHHRWAAVGLGFAYLTLTLGVEVRGALGPEPFFWLLAVVIGADVGGYMVGRAVGGPRLWPAVSPAKTWSGFCGSVVLAGTAGVVSAALGWVSWPQALMWSIPIGLVALAGDLSASAFKRAHACKDSSALIPGHGGLLDRADGVIPALLLFCLISAF